MKRCHSDFEEVEFRNTRSRNDTMPIDEKYTGIIMSRVFKNGVCSDQFSLISGKDNQRCPIHRTILIAASKFFAASLGPNFEEGKKDEFTMDDVDGETLKAIVAFCYTGCIDLTEENATKFVAIASFYGLDLLEEKCWRFYDGRLSVTNSADTLMIADKFGNAKLRQKAFDLVCGNLETMRENDVQQFDHRLLQEILKCDKVEATEEFVFKRLLEWFEDEEDERKQHMPGLLKLIRLEHIASEFLNGDLLQSTYKRCDCSDFVIAEYQRRLSNPFLSAGVRRCPLIYCLFNQNKGSESAEHSVVKIEKYNAALNSFEEASEISLGDRRHYGVIMRYNKIYILGGEMNGVILKSASAFDLNTGEEEVLPEMNFARSSFASILFENSIYVFGGWNGSACTNTCERFSIETKTWETLKSMKGAWYAASTSAANGYIYVAGGKKDQNIETATVELYDPRTDEWVQTASMENSRGGFALVESNGLLYAIGRKDGIEKFDPFKREWTKMESFEKSIAVTSAIEVGGEIFAITRAGDFGKIKLNEVGGSSFIPLCKSKKISKWMRNHFLFEN